MQILTDKPTRDGRVPATRRKILALVYQEVLLAESKHLKAPYRYDICDPSTSEITFSGKTSSQIKSMRCVEKIFDSQSIGLFGDDVLEFCEVQP